LPALFVGGEHVREGFQPSASTEFIRRCSLAGAAGLQMLDSIASENWSSVETGAGKGRVRLPKNFGGRRWYQDELDMAIYPDEHNESARIEYQKYLGAPQFANWYKPTTAGEKLMRQRTRMDEPHKIDETERRFKKRPDFTHMDLKLTRDWGVFGRTSQLRPMVSEDEFRNVTREMCAREGLSRDQLLWVLSLNRDELASELNQRHLRDKVVPAVGVDNLREALMDELRAERRYSPTRHVDPGSLVELTADQLAEEIKADSGTLLLVFVVNPRSPPSIRQSPQVSKAAARLQRAARVIGVNGVEASDVCRHFKVMRYPTLLWLSGRTGEELHREVGDTTWLRIYDITEALVHKKQLAPGADHREKIRALAEDRSVLRLRAAGSYDSELRNGKPSWVSAHR
jgi:hypothetical protein